MLRGGKEFGQICSPIGRERTIRRYANDRFDQHQSQSLRAAGGKRGNRGKRSAARAASATRRFMHLQMLRSCLIAILLTLYALPAASPTRRPRGDISERGVRLTGRGDMISGGTSLGSPSSSHSMGPSGVMMPFDR